MKRLLFVENEGKELEVLLRLSQDRGYFADGAPDAVSAAQLLQKQTYDAIIIDASEDTPLEGKSYLSEWIKQIFPGTRLIALTGEYVLREETSLWDRYYVVIMKLDFCMDFTSLYRAIEEP